MKGRVIYDVGMHLGEDAEFYLKKGFKVVGVEANPALCADAGARLVSYVDAGQLIIINAAITDRGGPVRFFVNDRRSVWGTTHEEWARRNEALGTGSREIIVPGVKMNQLFSKYGMPYYLKIDIEGADLVALSGLRQVSERPKFVSIESTKVSWASLVQEFDALCALGYSRFKVVNQLQVVNQVPPIPAREGQSVEHTFEEGSSGLFGEELPGKWLSTKEALSQYRRIFWQYRMFGDKGLLRWLTEPLAAVPGLWRLRDLSVAWYDTHATR